MPSVAVDAHRRPSDVGRESGVALQAEVSTNAQTGVEMEALTAVSVAALTVYDMCKALEKGMSHHGRAAGQ